MAWLGATSVHSRDYDAVAHGALTALLDVHPPLSLIVNHFDPGGQLYAPQPPRNHPRITYTWLADMKVTTYLLVEEIPRHARADARCSPR
jgi:hypothetical protein